MPASGGRGGCWGAAAGATALEEEAARAPRLVDACVVLARKPACLGAVQQAQGSRWWAAEQRPDMKRSGAIS